MIVRWFFEFGFKLLVSSSNYFIEFLFLYLEQKRELECFVVQRTGTAADTSDVGFARSLDLLPTETNPTPARSSTSSVSVLRSSARLPWSVTCMSRSFHRTTRATRARLSVVNASRACVSDVALLCFHPCVGLNARVRAVRAPARDVSSHTSVFFATCTHQFTIHFITTKPFQTHTSDEAPHTGSHESQGRVARSATSCSFQFAARPTRCHVVPRFCPRYQALKKSSTRPHIRDASRARVPDVTRGDGHERVIHNVRSSGWLHR